MFKWNLMKFLSLQWNLYNFSLLSELIISMLNLVFEWKRKKNLNWKHLLEKQGKYWLIALIWMVTTDVKVKASLYSTISSSRWNYCCRAFTDYYKWLHFSAQTSMFTLLYIIHVVYTCTLYKQYCSICRSSFIHWLEKTLLIE